MKPRRRIDNLGHAPIRHTVLFQWETCKNKGCDERHLRGLPWRNPCTKVPAVAEPKDERKTA